jgi:hypothetical protein
MLVTNTGICLPVTNLQEGPSEEALSKCSIMAHLIQQNGEPALEPIKVSGAPAYRLSVLLSKLCS